MEKGGRKKTVGAWGEEQAARFLERQGFEVVERNFHATVGEIDIVARKGDDFYFVEVKTRRAGPLGFDTAVTTAKKHKLQKTIARYCVYRGVRDVGLIPASLMVVVDRDKQTVSFRLAVLY